jgi:hypothetical protein
VLMHISSRQLAQRPKILSIQYSNTVQGSYYNVFIKDSIVVFVTQYYKGYNVSSNVKIIY